MSGARTCSRLSNIAAVIKGSSSSTGLRGLRCGSGKACRSCGSGSAVSWYSVRQPRLREALRPLCRQHSSWPGPAIAGYRALLQGERTRLMDPGSWARTQNNLGNTLFSLGSLTGNPKRLEEAIAAVRNVLKVLTSISWRSVGGYRRECGSRRDLGVESDRACRA